MHLLGIHVDVPGCHGKRGRNVLHLVVVDTGIDLEKFGIISIVQVVKPLKPALAMTWREIMIDLAMQYAITVHIQVEAAAVKQGGMDDAAATVCMKFLFCINLVPQIKRIFFYSICEKNNYTL